MARRKSKSEAERVRLQIPMPADQVDEINNLAEFMDYTQPRMMIKLLAIAVAERKAFASWLGKKIQAAKNTSRFQGELVVAQVRMRADDTTRIEELSSLFGNTTARMAALLIEFAIDDTKWLRTRLGRFAQQKIDQAFGRSNADYEDKAA